MAQVISYTKEHGFHEPNVPINDFVKEARELGIDVKEVTGWDESSEKPFSNIMANTLKGEIAAVNIAKTTKWHDADSTVRHRVRAIQAEWELKKLRKRLDSLKQGDTSGIIKNMEDEREAFLKQIQEDADRISELETKLFKVKSAETMDAVLVYELEKSVQRLKDDIAEKDNQLAEFAPMVNALQLEVSGLREANMQLKDGFNREIEVSSALSDELTCLREDVATKVFEIENLVNQIKEQEADIKDLETQRKLQMVSMEHLRDQYELATQPHSSDEVKWLRELVYKLVDKLHSV